MCWTRSWALFPTPTRRNATMTKKIDTHAHLGECCVFGLYATEEDMIRRMDESGVDATIVQPYPGAKDYVKRHDEIAELCAKYPGRFFGLASLSPHVGQ